MHRLYSARRTEINTSALRRNTSTSVMNCIYWILVLCFVYLMPQIDARNIRTNVEIEWTGIEVFNCSSELDCPVGHCCIELLKVSETEFLGVCREHKKIGEHCLDKFWPGDGCPCARGLTCRKDSFSKDQVHTCETVAIHQEPWGMFKEKM